MIGRICFLLLVLCVLVTSCGTASTPQSPQPTDSGGGISMACSQVSLRPVLAPQYLPQELDRLTMLQCESDHFLTEYRGPTKRLLIGAGALNPPVMDRGGQQKQVTVRAQPGTLQISDVSYPDKAVQLWWEEPGQWTPAAGAAARDSVFYLLSAEGIGPQDLLRIAEGLRPLELSDLPVR